MPSPRTTAQTARRNRTVDLKAQARRLREDFELWARTCYRIVDKEDNLVPLVLNKPQREVYQVERNLLRDTGRARIYNLKARQAGFSTREQAHQLWVTWGKKHSRVLTLCDQQGNTDKVFKITRTAIKEFPDPLLPKLGGATAREVSFPAMNSYFWTGTAGSKTVGVGLTLNRLHASEFAMWDEPRETLSTASPGLERPGTTIVLETTASAHGSEAHEFWLEAQEGKNGYTALFYPWWECDPVFYRLPLLAQDELGELSGEERHLVERHGLDHEQIKWRRAQIREKGKAEFLKQYAEDPESCWLVSGSLFFDGESLRALHTRASEPITEQAVHVDGWSGHIDIHMVPEGFKHEREKVIIGVDTAEGGGGDSTAWVARTYPSWRLLEEFADPYIEPKQAASLLASRGRRYGDAMLVVEKNMHGITVLRELRDSAKYPTGKIFHETKYDESAKKPTRKMGWTTTAQNHPQMLDAARALINAALDGQADAPSERGVRDMFNVKRDEKGKVELTGRDVLVAEMLAWQGRNYAGGQTESFSLPI